MPNAVISSAKGAIQKYWWLCIVFALLFTAVPVFTSGAPPLLSPAVTLRPPPSGFPLKLQPQTMNPMMQPTIPVL